MSKLGINGASNAPIKHENKTKDLEIKEWNEKNVEEDLVKQITILRNGKSNYLTLSKLAAGYMLTSRAFRDKCLMNDDLANKLQIYNSVYVEHIMTEAIKTGKINAQTEDFLKNELQAFTGTGFEQNIKWILDKGELKHRDTGESFEIEVDVDKKVEEKVPLLWESNNEDNKE